MISVGSASKTGRCCHCSHKPGCWHCGGEGDGFGPALAGHRVQRGLPTLKKPSQVGRLPWRLAKYCGKMSQRDYLVQKIREVVLDEETFELRPSGLWWGKGGEAFCLSRDPKVGMSISCEKASVAREQREEGEPIVS